jgi:hypothetical protein
MIAYVFGLSLAPTLVGFLLSLGVIRLVFKVKVIWQIKIATYVAALISSTIVHIVFSPLSDSGNVVIGTILGFAFPIVTIFLIKTSQKSKRTSEV